MTGLPQLRPIIDRRVRRKTHYRAACARVTLRLRQRRSTEEMISIRLAARPVCVARFVEYQGARDARAHLAHRECFRLLPCERFMAYR